MIKMFGIPMCGARAAMLLLSSAIAGLAQMGGGMHGGDGASGSLGGMTGGSLSAMMGGGTGLTIGPDGTLYVTRSLVAQAGQNTTTQLEAIDTDGNTKWTLPINSGTASQPALGKDGTLFVTTSDWFNWMYDWMYSRTTPAAGTTASLLVIKPGTNSASIIASVPLTGQVASAPQIAVDSAGSYLVFIVSVDAFLGNGFNDTSSSGSYLYAFSPAGVQKYRLQLSQGGSGTTMSHGRMGF